MIKFLLFFILSVTIVRSGTRPNIVFIFADDWGWGDLGCHGHPYVKTPNIDRLAAEGTDFHRFSVASGVCSPSRAAVLTGHFPARYRIDGHFSWVHRNAKRGMPDWLSPSAPLLPRMLKSAGYATGHFGKWHLSNNMVPDSPLPSAYGFDVYGAYNCAGEQMPVHDDARQAVAFMRKSHAAGKPFFVNLWVHEPHLPFHVVPKYEWRFRGLSRADGIYASVLSHADERIGEVLGCLDDMGLADETLVIFSSDNGPARAGGGKTAVLDFKYDSATGVGYGIGAARGVTGGRRGYKGALLEGGIGVPFIVRWPGKVAVGRVDNVSLLSAVDLLPTLCEVAGAKLPDGYEPDGVSQVGALMGRVSGVVSREKPLFWKTDAAWPVRKGKPEHWVCYAILHKQWKMVMSAGGERVELYDIGLDPYEKKNLAADNAGVVGALRVRLEKWRSTLPEEADAGCFSVKRKRG